MPATMCVTWATATCGHHHGSTRIRLSHRDQKRYLVETRGCIPFTLGDVPPMFLPAAECALSSHVVPLRTFDYAKHCFRHRALSEGLHFGSPLSARAAAPGLDVARIWPCCCGLSSASSRSPVPACRPHSIPVNSKVVGASADFAPRPSKLSRLCASSFPSRLLVSRTQHDASQQCSRHVV